MQRLGPNPHPRFEPSTGPAQFPQNEPKPNEPNISLKTNNRYPPPHKKYRAITKQTQFRVSAARMRLTDKLESLQ